MSGVLNKPSVIHGPDWAPWQGRKSGRVLAVDPGGFGGVVAGSSLADVRVVPYPRTSEDCRDWMHTLRASKIETLDTAFYYELRQATDKLPGGAKRVYALGKDDGIWHVLSAVFSRRQGLYPASWRRIVFKPLLGEQKVSGGLEWKKLEFKLCKLLTGNRLIQTDSFYSSDHAVYGISAAFCIWLAGAQSEGLIKITQEVTNAKSRLG
jgi:hypothetical protein